MSLSVYLISDTPFEREPTSGIFIRENGSTREISREEWDARNPGREPVALRSPDPAPFTLYCGNITHNLGQMARAAEVFDLLWQPDTVDISHAEQLIDPLTQGLVRLCRSPARFKAYNPENGWGDYDAFVLFVARYLIACCEHPEAKIEVSR